MVEGRIHTLLSNMTLGGDDGKQRYVDRQYYRNDGGGVVGWLINAIHQDNALFLLSLCILILMNRRGGSYC